MERIIVIALGSALYWAAAAAVVVFAGGVLPGDCGTERTPVGLHECLREVRIIVIVGFALAAVLYGILLRRLARNL